MLVALIALGIVQTTDQPLAATLLLLPQHQSPLLGVSWTLQHEMLFYLACAVVILSRNAGIALLAAWCLLMLTGCIHGIAPEPWAPASLVWNFLAAPYQLQFLLGIVTAAAVLAERVPAPRTVLVMGIFGVVATASLENVNLIAYLGLASQALFGIFSACTIAGMATAEQRGLLRVNKPALLIGAASYTIYLVHYPAIALARCYPLPLAIPDWLAMFVLTLAGVGTGIALHLVAERPILRLLRGITTAHRIAEGTSHAARETA